MSLILKQLFQLKVISCIQNYNWSLYEENNTFHISTSCLTLIDLKDREKLIGFFVKFVERFNVRSIVGLSEGTDQGITTF